MEKFEIEENENAINTWIQTDANEYHGHIKIARIYHGDKQPSEVARLAKLLRAAPELLKDLKEALDWISLLDTPTGFNHPNEMLKRFEKTIKKATS